MVITLFWSRLREDLGAEGLADYQADAARMLALAQRYPSFVSFKAYAAEDGERLGVVVFQFGGAAGRMAQRSGTPGSAAAGTGSILRGVPPDGLRAGAGVQLAARGAHGERGARQ